MCKLFVWLVSLGSLMCFLDLVRPTNTFEQYRHRNNIHQHLGYPASFTSNQSAILAIMASIPTITKHMPILSSTLRAASITMADYRRTSSMVVSRPSNGAGKIPIRIGNPDGHTRPMRRMVRVAMAHILHLTQAISNC